MPLPAERMTTAESGWSVDPSVPLGDEWHGACVIAVKDGFLVGLLLHDEGQSLVAPVSSSWVKGGSSR